MLVSRANNFEKKQKKKKKEVHPKGNIYVKEVFTINTKNLRMLAGYTKTGIILKELLTLFAFLLEHFSKQEVNYIQQKKFADITK